MTKYVIFYSYKNVRTNYNFFSLQTREILVYDNPFGSITYGDCHNYCRVPNILPTYITRDSYRDGHLGCYSGQ